MTLVGQADLVYKTDPNQFLASPASAAWVDRSCGLSCLPRDNARRPRSADVLDVSPSTHYSVYQVNAPDDLNLPSAPRVNGGGAASTLAATLAARLREMIIEGELPPGTRLNERALCDRLGASRTPLREAFRLLAAEHLVELQILPVAQRLAEVPVDVLAYVRTRRRLAWTLAVVGSAHPNTHAGTLRQPCSSSTSSGFQPGSRLATSAQ